MKHIEITESYGRLRKRVQTLFTESEVKDQKIKSADQSFANEVDINEIMRKMAKTGDISHLAKHQGQFADVSDIPDLHTAMIQVVEAQQAFDVLPATLRRRFGNSPVEMVNFLQDPANYEESIKLGLRTRPPVGPGSQEPAETKGAARGSPSTSLQETMFPQSPPQSKKQSLKQKLQQKLKDLNNDDELNDDE